MRKWRSLALWSAGLAVVGFGCGVADDMFTSAQCAESWEAAGPPSDHPADRAEFIKKCSSVSWQIDVHDERFTRNACAEDEACLEQRREDARRQGRWMAEACNEGLIDCEPGWDEPEPQDPAWPL